MDRPRYPFRGRRGLAPILIAGLMALAGSIPAATVAAAESGSMVLDWNQYAIAALVTPTTATPAGAGQSPPVSSLHLAMVQTAVYDAVNAIARTNEPYLKNLPKPSRRASKAAAAATAAHHVLVGLVPSLPDGVKTQLDGLYASSLASIPNSWRKTAGINIGATVAARMLANRATDGRFVPFSFTSSTAVGKWRPELPSMLSDPFAWVAKVRPFALRSPSQFRTRGPLSLTSIQYAIEFNEVKAVGSIDSTQRTTAQTDLARFYSVHTLPLFYAGFRDIAKTKGLSITRAARLLGMLSVASADALIACWDDKVYWSFWRPITAIREAANDGNPATTTQDGWLPMLPTPPYPDHPSGYNCFSGAMVAAGRAFFGTDYVRISLTSSATNTTRSYNRLSSILRDTINARIYLGFHFRTPDVQGAKLGRNVGRYVADHFFEPEDDDDD